MTSISLTHMVKILHNVKNTKFKGACKKLEYNTWLGVLWSTVKLSDNNT